MMASQSAEGTLFQPVGETVDLGAVGSEGRCLSQLAASLGGYASGDIFRGRGKGDGLSAPPLTPGEGGPGRERRPEPAAAAPGAPGRPQTSCSKFGRES